MSEFEQDRTHEESSSIGATSKLKRKERETGPEVWVWDHFTKSVDEKGCIKGKCNYCEKEFCFGAKDSQTTTLEIHLNACKKYPYNIEIMGDSEDMSTLCSQNVDQQYMRESLAHMVIVDGLPFKLVEGEGFKEFMAVVCPCFEIPSQLTLVRDCYRLYVKERLKLKNFLKNNCQRICISTDIWNSLQGKNYMCITAHFIDNEWKLQKKILNFCPVSTDEGKLIGKAIEKYMVNWGIDKVLTITMDNNSSNEDAITYLKNKFTNCQIGIANCKYLHIRCIAHVINIVVVEGLKEVSLSVKRVRDAIIYIKQSPLRLEKFKECAEAENIQCKSSLRLDVSTSWYSTYLMLSTAEKYEKAFEMYEKQDPDFKTEMEMEAGVPTFMDWSAVRKMTNVLQQFYETALRISTSPYVTSNIFWTEISDIIGALLQKKRSDDLDMKDMSDRMKVNFDKYLGDFDKMNKLIYVAIVFDPREKFEVMEYAFCQIYGKENGSELFANVKGALFELFDEYKNMLPPKSGHSTEGCFTKPRGLIKSEFKKHILESENRRDKKSELERYLDEPILDDKDDFDILQWWKISSERFPILSRMARDILAIPVFTMTSKSVFSTDGRVLNEFRSTLPPMLLEAMICAQSWLRKSPCQSDTEEDIDELEEFENDLPTVGFGGFWPALGGDA